MKEKWALILMGILGVVVFLIGVLLNPLLNLVSADLQNWYLENRSLALGLTSVLIIMGAVLTFTSVWLSSRREQNVFRKDETDTAERTDATAVLKAVYQAYRVSPGDKVHSEIIQQTLGLSERVAIDLITRLEERGFLKATWVGRKALLTITEDGITLLRDN